MDDKVWIFVKRNGAGQDVYRVHPSPKAARKDGALTFINLTNGHVSSSKGNKPGNDIMSEPLDIQGKGKQSVKFRDTAEPGSYEYQLWVDDVPAHGAWSDPDIIIDP